MTLPRDDHDEEKALLQTPKPQRIDWALLKSMYKQIFQRLAMFDGSIVFVVMASSMGEMRDENGNNTNYKAAAALSINLLNLAIVVAVYPLLSFIQVGTDLMIEMMTGSNKADAQRKYSRLPRNLALIVALPTIAASVTLYNGEKIWRSAGKDPEIARLAGTFLRPCTAIPLLLYGRFMSDLILLFQGQGNFVMGVTLACLALFGVGLGETLGFGWFNAPELQMTGTAIGFIMQMAMSWLILNSFIRFSPLFKDYTFRRDLLKRTSDDKAQMKALLPLALTYEATIVSEILAQTVTTSLPQDSDQIAALNYLAIINLAAFLWSHGVGQITQQMIKQEKDQTKVQRLIIYSVAVSLTPVPLYLLIAILANYAPKLLYNSSYQQITPEVEHYANILIPYACAIGCLYAPTFVNLENLKATKEFAIPIVVSMVGIWLGVLMSALLQPSRGVTGVIQGNLLGISLALLVSLFSVKKTFWSRPQAEVTVLSDDPEAPATPTPARAPSAWCSCFGETEGRVLPSTTGSSVQLQQRLLLN